MTDHPEPKPPPPEPDADANGHASSAWDLPEQEPTNLVALWPGAEAPTQTEVLAAFTSIADRSVEVDEELETEGEDVPWGVAVRAAGREVPIILWAEPARDLAEDEIAYLQAGNCQWAVGVESILDPENPLADYADLVRLVAAALDDCPAVLDVNTAHWYRRLDLDDMFGGGGSGDGDAEAIEPPAEVLWTIHAVSPDQPGGGDGENENENAATWLHTHGLWRCGRAELEMLEVPRRYVASAGHLMNCIAESMLDRELAEPGEPMEVGADLVVATQPWNVVAPYVADDIPGSMKDRVAAPENAHIGVRAVICAPSAAGTFKKVWVWPQQVIETLENGDSVIYMTQRATARRAARAIATWEQLATAFATCRQQHEHDDDHPTCAFLVKAGFSDPEDEDRREHLWFRVEGFEGAAARAELLNEPIIVKNLDQGETTSIERNVISDWQVFTTFGAFGPYETGALWRAIDELSAGEEPSSE
ncbi:MAG: DUF4026 domain-containing protein [Planctomycetota bacterium]|jgi:uncharacterized protein YegJ (DUF2314 family)